MAEKRKKKNTRWMRSVSHVIIYFRLSRNDNIDRMRVCFIKKKKLITALIKTKQIIEV